MFVDAIYFLLKLVVRKTVQETWVFSLRCNSKIYMDILSLLLAHDIQRSDKCLRDKLLITILWTVEHGTPPTWVHTHKNIIIIIVFCLIKHSFKILWTPGEENCVFGLCLWICIKLKVIMFPFVWPCSTGVESRNVYVTVLQEFTLHLSLWTHLRYVG